MSERNKTLLKGAGIPRGLWDVSFDEENAPEHLKEVVNNLAQGVDEYYDGAIFTPGKKTNLTYALQAYIIVAKEVALETQDAMYVTPLQLIATLGEQDREHEIYTTQNLFVDTLYIAGTECPYSLRERAMLKELFQFRYFNDVATSIFIFGNWKTSTWYDTLMVGLFSKHTEVQI